MTHLPPDPDVPDLDEDEIAVHAVLDGEATPEQRRVVARDPALRVRLDELRAVAAAVRATPPAPSAVTFDAIRAQALAAMDVDEADDLGTEAAAGSSPERDERPPDADEVVVPLAARRQRRLPPLPAVAAVVAVLLAIGVGLILTDRGDGEQRANLTTAGDAASADPEATTGADAADELGRDDDQGYEGDEPEGRSERALGATDGPEFSDDDALRTALQTVDPSTLVTLHAATSGPETTGSEASSVPLDSGSYASDAEVQRCSAVLEASDPDIQPVQAAAPVRVDGERLVVLSNPVQASEDSPASIRLTVLEPVGCVPRFAVAR